MMFLLACWTEIRPPIDQLEVHGEKCLQWRADRKREDPEVYQVHVSVLPLNGCTTSAPLCHRLTTFDLPGDVQRIQRLPDVLPPPEEELCELEGRAAGALSGPASTYQLQRLCHCTVVPLHSHHQHLHLANRYQRTLTVILWHNTTDCCTPADDPSTAPPAPDVSYREFETPLPTLRLRRSADSLETIRYNQQGELKQCWHHHSKGFCRKNPKPFLTVCTRCLCFLWRVPCCSTVRVLRCSTSLPRWSWDELGQT